MLAKKSLIHGEQVKHDRAVELQTSKSRVQIPGQAVSFIYSLLWSLVIESHEYEYEYELGI